EVAAGSACRGARVGRKSWRKAAGVEPTRKRLAPPPGFEAQPHHRVRVPSAPHLRALVALFARDGAAAAPGEASMGRLDDRHALSGRRTCASRTRRVYPTRSKNSRIWMARLRPTPRVSRKRAALTPP